MEYFPLAHVSIYRILPRIKHGHYGAKRYTDICPKKAITDIFRRKIRKLCALYRYEEIRTPMFEKTELFVRGVGQETDIVQKEMYTFEHRNKESFSLKPEGTAAVVRAYGENKLYSQPQPVKLYYITPCFRAERPQKGRYRQFHQFGIEVLGTKSAGIDAEVIAVAARLFVLLQIKNIKLYINSVGCGNIMTITMKVKGFFSRI